MRCDQCGQSGVPHQPHHRGKHPVGGVGIEVPGRLVRQKDARRIRQRAAEGDPLLFAARERRRAMPRPFRHPDGGQKLLRPRPRRTPRDAIGELGQDDVFFGRELRQEMVELVDKADLIAAHGGAAAVAEALHRLGQGLADADDHQAWTQAWGGLPAASWVDEVQRGTPPPAGLTAQGPVPRALLDALATEAAEPVAELMTAWAPLWDVDDVLPGLLSAHPAARWSARLVPLLRHWQQDVDRAVAVALVVGEAQSLALEPALQVLPDTRVLDVLLSLAPILDDAQERLVDRLLPAPGARRRPHPIDELPAVLGARLWRVVEARAQARDPERARKALWSLASRREADEHLAAAHGHPARRVRAYAHRLARRELPAEQWTELALGLLDDPHPALQRQVLRTLAFRRYRPALPHLITLLGRGRPALRAVAADALRAYGPDALDALRHWLPKVRPDRRAAISALIDELAPDEGS